jgi:hypothetical protein
MKKAIAVVLSVMFVFALTTATFAAEKKEMTEKKEMAAEKKAEKKKVAHKQITGEVTAVDAKANTITVKSKKAEVTVTVDDKTKFMPKGKTIADVAAGEKVMVKYTEAEGTNTAKSVKVMAKKAAKKMKEKKEAAPAPAMEEKAPAKKPAAGY